MVASLVQMFDLFTQPTGSVIYHLVLVFSIVSALQSAVFHLRASGFPQARRTVFGLSFLLSAQVALFILSALGNEGLINLSLFLPPVDRALTLFALVWMIWLWTFPEPSRASDAATALVSLLVAAAFALSLVYYAQTPTIPYNLTTFDSYWQIGSLAIAAFGLFLLIVRRPNGWGNGMAIFLLAFAGHLLHLIVGRTDGDFPGAVRLAYMAAYP
ncbi:MAG TPA: hypothetical protein VLM78_07230, partial [Anaerolineales bacterium]|nr:hypothetical protein [Anaerolineales bacterium]